MIASDGRPCLSDVGMHSSFSKVVFSEAWHVPWSWAFKPPEELSFDCDPSAFAPTKAMDVYSFANTVYTVCLCFMLVALPWLTHYCLLSDRSSLPTHPSPPSQKGEGLRRSWLVVTSSKDQRWLQFHCGIFCSGAGHTILKIDLPLLMLN